MSSAVVAPVHASMNLHAIPGSDLERVVDQGAGHRASVAVVHATDWRAHKTGAKRDRKGEGDEEPDRTGQDRTKQQREARRPRPELVRVD